MSNKKYRTPANAPQALKPAANMDGAGVPILVNDLKIVLNACTIAKKNGAFNNIDWDMDKNLCDSVQRLRGVVANIEKTAPKQAGEAPKGKPKLPQKQPAAKAA